MSGQFLPGGRGEIVRLGWPRNWNNLHFVRHRVPSQCVASFRNRDDGRSRVFIWGLFIICWRSQMLGIVALPSCYSHAISYVHKMIHPHHLPPNPLLPLGINVTYSLDSFNITLPRAPSPRRFYSRCRTVLKFSAISHTVGPPWDHRTRPPQTSIEAMNWSVLWDPPLDAGRWSYCISWFYWAILYFDYSTSTTSVTFSGRPYGTFESFDMQLSTHDPLSSILRFSRGVK